MGRQRLLQIASARAPALKGGESCGPEESAARCCRGPRPRLGPQPRPSGPGGAQRQPQAGPVREGGARAQAPPPELPLPRLLCWGCCSEMHFSLLLRVPGALGSATWVWEKLTQWFSLIAPGHCLYSSQGPHELPPVSKGLPITAAPQESFAHPLHPLSQVQVDSLGGRWQLQPQPASWASGAAASDAGEGAEPADPRPRSSDVETALLSESSATVPVPESWRFDA